MGVIEAGGVEEADSGVVEGEGRGGDLLGAWLEKMASVGRGGGGVQELWGKGAAQESMSWLISRVVSPGTRDTKVVFPAPVTPRI